MKSITSAKVLTLAVLLTSLSAGAAAQAGSIAVTGDSSRVGSLDGVTEAIRRMDARCGHTAKSAACVIEMSGRIGQYLAAKASEGVEASEHTRALIAEFSRQDEIIGTHVADAYELYARSNAGKAGGAKPARAEKPMLVARASKPDAKRIEGARAAGIAPMPLLIPMLMTGCTVTVSGGTGDTGSMYSTSCTYSDADPDMFTQWKMNYRAGVYWGCNDFNFGYAYSPETLYGTTSYFDYWTFAGDTTYVNSSCFDYGYSDGWDDYIVDGGYRFTCWDDVLYY